MVCTSKSLERKAKLEGPASTTKNSHLNTSLIFLFDCLMSEHALAEIPHHGVSIHVDLLLLGVMLDPTSSDTLAIQVSALLQLLRDLIIDVGCERKSQ